VTSHCTPSTPTGTSPLRYVAATRCPDWASRAAIWCPIPLLPPVTRIVREVLGAAAGAGGVVVTEVTLSTPR
jgi:hypothetical protein